MASATNNIVQPVIREVTLTLSEDEAETLITLLAYVHSGPTNKVQTFDIYCALSSAGVRERLDVQISLVPGDIKNLITFTD